MRLRHRDTFAIADPVERVTRAALESSTLTNPLADAMTRAKPVESRREAAATAPIARPSPVSVPTPLVPVPGSLSTPTARPVDLSKVLRPTDRVALFVDGANTDGSARAAGYFLDFRKAREFLIASARSYACFYIVSARAQLSRELAYVADKPIVYLEEHRDILARADRSGPV